jgi:hypothetical protein
MLLKKKALAIHWLEWTDPYEPKYINRITFTVYEPNECYPLPAILVTAVNGGGSVMMRFASVQHLEMVFPVPPMIRSGLSKAMDEANSVIGRVETSSVLAEADRILKGVE